MARTDLDAVMAIEQRVFPQPWSRAFFEKELATAFATLRVAVEPDGDADAPIGYSVYWRVTDEVHLLNVAVRPDRQHLGIGRILVDAVLADSRSIGARVIFLEVRAGNVRARSLYARMGFRELGVRRAYYGPGQDAIVMECRLGTPT
jgi:[ribosomal protein S18]-alanine N-acetyltransferase